MILLGINDTHDSSACLIIDGKIIGAVQEERLVRKKSVSSLPIKSIKYLLNKNNISYSDIDAVAVATKFMHHLNLWNIHADFKIKDWHKLQEKYYYPLIYKKKKIKFKYIFSKFKPSIKLGYPVKKIAFKSSDEVTKKDIEDIRNLRINTISSLLKINKNRIFFYDHHLCHAMYGYYTSKRFKKTIVITADGGGDGNYETVSTFINGEYKNYLASNNNWIGKIYSTITLLLGLNPSRHLYKVMGLAPYANREKYNHILKILLNSLKVKGIGFRVNPAIKDRYFYFKEKLQNERFDNISGAVQKFTEIRLIDWFRNCSRKFKINNFVFSGGVANNVKANQELSKQNFVKNLWIPAGPGDESLCMGATFAHIYHTNGYLKAEKLIDRPRDAYWGPNISKKEIFEFKNSKIIKDKFNFTNDKNFKKAAQLLNKGEIIFLCMGNQEFGQRALGHRSIICDPSKIDVVKKINSTIKMRDFWMPFCPSILNTHEKKYLHGMQKMDHEFMTSSVELTKIGKEHLKAASHYADQTSRPQIVKHNKQSKYFELINAFKNVSGIGAVLNTSLNMHEFPIITSPSDIIREIINKNNSINFNILIEDCLFIKK